MEYTVRLERLVSDLQEAAHRQCKPRNETRTPIINRHAETVVVDQEELQCLKKVRELLAEYYR